MTKTEKVTGCIQTKEGRRNYYLVLSTYDEKGKRNRKWIHTGIPAKGDTRRQVKAKLKEVLTECNAGNVEINKDVNFTVFMVKRLENLRYSISPTTHDAYGLTLKNHILPYFERKKLKVTEVTPIVIQKYVNVKLETLSPNSVRKHLTNISKCNPVKRIEMPKKIKFTGAKHYNEKQIEQLLECAKGDPLEIVIRLTLFYGLRRSEILGIRWQAVNFEERTIAINHTVVKIGNITHKNDRTKNASSCTVFPMPEKVMTELLRWREHQQALKTLQPNDYHDSGYVCTYPDGRLLSTDFVSQHFARLLRKNGMPHIRFHDLRHSAACCLKHLGFDLKDIQTWLRHKDIQTTMNLYVTLDMDAKSSIADSLDARFQLLEARQRRNFGRHKRNW